MFNAAEQATRSVFQLSGNYPDLEVEMTIRLEIPAGEQDVDVAVALLYEPKFPEHLQDELHGKVYDGVHGGLAAVNSPLPASGLAVKVLRLSVSHLDSGTEENIQRISNVLETLTAWTVAALWGALQNLSYDHEG